MRSRVAASMPAFNTTSSNITFSIHGKASGTRNFTSPAAVAAATYPPIRPHVGEEAPQRGAAPVARLVMRTHRIAQRIAHVDDARRAHVNLRIARTRLQAFH